MPYQATTTWTLNLTLADGTTTGAKPVRFWGTAAVASNYAAGSIIPLVYRSGAWYVSDRDTNSDTVDRDRFNTYIKYAIATTKYAICCGTTNGYQKIAPGVSFDLSYPLLYSNEGSTQAAGDLRNNFYSFTPGVDIRNTVPGFVSRRGQALFLVGAVTNDTFTIGNPALSYEPTRPCIPLGMFNANADNSFCFLPGPLMMPEAPSGGGGADMTSVSNAVSDLMVAAVAENPVESTLEVLRMAVAELWESHDKLAGLEAYDNIADAIDAMVSGPLTNYPPRTEVSQNLAGYVPTSRKVNNKALSANITLSAADVGALPVSGYSATSSADIGSDPYIYVEFYGSTRILSYTGTGTLEVGGLYAPNGPPCHLVLSGFSSVSWPNGWYPIIDGTYDSSGANYYEVGSVNGQSYVRFLFSFQAP